MSAQRGLAVVTGAARGIGRSIAEQLVADGHDAVLVDVADDVRGVADELGTSSETVVPVVSDLTTSEGRAAVERAVDDATSALRVLVNNAGITRDALLTKMEESAFTAVIDVNLGAAYELTAALQGRFVDGGAIVNMSSRAYLGNVGQFNYSASKGGLVGLTRALAIELAPRVRVNAVAPGFTATEMSLAVPEEVRAKLVPKIPAGRMAEPGEIADVVAYLVSDSASYVTGQVLVTCGGRSL